MRVRKAEIGTHQQYVAGEISDHVPLVVDYAITARSA